MTLSDLAQYSVTRNIARSLCDSWASCVRNASRKTLPRIFAEYVRRNNSNYVICRLRCIVKTCKYIWRKCNRSR